MDVFGRKPSSETGNYFRNTIGWWSGLWEYCEAVAPDITSKVRHGYSNDGDGLDAHDAQLLSSILLASIRKGYIDRWIKDRAEYYAKTDFSRTKCQLCFGTGTLTLRVQEFKDGALTPLQTSTSECSTCNGTGYARPLIANTPFSAENVTNFAAFLKDSGGFEIW